MENTLCSCIGRINIVKMTTLPNAIYRFDAISIKIPIRNCHKNRINNLKKFFWSFLFVFLGPFQQHMEVPRLGSNQSCSRSPAPQQLGIQATSATYTTAHGSTGSLPHWARPRIEPMTSWILVSFANCWAMMGTPKNF